MAPKPRPMKNQPAHPPEDHNTATSAPSIAHQKASQKPTPSSAVRKTRASAASATARVPDTTQNEASTGHMNAAASPTPVTLAAASTTRAAQKHARSRPPQGAATTEKAPSTTSTARKRATHDAAPPVPAKKSKTKASTESTAKAKGARTEVRRAPRPPVEDHDVDSPSDEEIALAVAATRNGGKNSRTARQSTSKQPNQQHTASREDADLDGDADVDGEESEPDDGASQAEDDAGADEEARSASSDGLESDAEALAAQLAAERPLWANKKSATQKRRAPPTYADIGAPRSARAEKLLDRRVYSSSPDLSDSDYRPGDHVEEQEEEEDVEMPEDDDEEEREWLETIRKRAARAKANKALPPLLPPATNPSEQPLWKTGKPPVGPASASATTMVMSAFSRSNPATDVASDNEEPDAAVEDQPPPPVHGEGPDVQPQTAYTIIQPDGGGLVKLTAQHIHIRKTVSETLPRLEAKLAFDNVFPDTITLAQDVHQTLIEVAESLGYTGLVAALRFNNQISAPVAAIVRQRMSTYRGGVKKHADTHAVAFFHLKKGCEEQVKALFDFMAYAYVNNWDAATGKLDVTWRKPYGNEVITAMLHQCFFTGQSSLASTNADRFTSCLDLRSEEKEIPIPMLAFVCTAIHAALTEWRSGTHAHVSFSADAFLDAYNEHKLILNGIKEKNIRAFHKMMHTLYREASGAAPTNNEAAAAAANQALAHVDIANMDVD